MATNDADYTRESLPITSAMQRCLTQTGQQLRWVGWAITAFCVAMPVAMVATYVLTATGVWQLRGGGDEFILIAAAILAVVFWFVNRLSQQYFRMLSSRADDPTFYRYTGPVAASTPLIKRSAANNAYVVFLVDRVLHVEDPIPEIPLAIVDHAASGALVFEIRDADGQLYYRNGSYKP